MCHFCSVSMPHAVIVFALILFARQYHLLAARKSDQKPNEKCVSRSCTLPYNCENEPADRFQLNEQHSVSISLCVWGHSLSLYWLGSFLFALAVHNSVRCVCHFFCQSNEEEFLALHSRSRQGPTKYVKHTWVEAVCKQVCQLPECLLKGPTRLRCALPTCVSNIHTPTKNCHMDRKRNLSSW